jgi:hypothetical protein
MGIFQVLTDKTITSSSQGKCVGTSRYSSHLELPVVAILPALAVRGDAHTLQQQQQQGTAVQLELTTCVC